DVDHEAAVRFAHDFGAGEAVPVDGVGHRPSLGVVEGDRPVARRWCQTADHEGAAAIKGISRVVAPGIESDAVARPDRELAGARDARPRVRVDTPRAALRPGGPGANRERAEGDAVRERQPGHAKPDDRREYQREARTEKKAHVRPGGKNDSSPASLAAISRDV